MDLKPSSRALIQKISKATHELSHDHSLPMRELFRSRLHELYQRTIVSTPLLLSLQVCGAISDVEAKKIQTEPDDYNKCSVLYDGIFKRQAIKEMVVAFERSNNHFLLEMMNEWLDNDRLETKINKVVQTLKQKGEEDPVVELFRRHNSTLIEKTVNADKLASSLRGVLSPYQLNKIKNESVAKDKLDIIYGITFQKQATSALILALRSTGNSHILELMDGWVQPFHNTEEVVKRMTFALDKLKLQEEEFPLSELLRQHKKELLEKLECTEAFAKALNELGVVSKRQLKKIESEGNGQEKKELVYEIITRREAGTEMVYALEKSENEHILCLLEDWLK